MNSTAVVKGIGTGFAGVVALLALSAPAYASPDPGPGYPGGGFVDTGGGGNGAQAGLPPVVDDSWEVLQVATGALAGLGVAAAGFAAIEITRRHGHHHGHAVG